MRSTRPLLVLAALGAGLLAWRRLELFPVRVSGASMEPTLSDGDLLVVSPVTSPRVGCVVVVRARGVEMVKRLTALGARDAIVEGDARDESTNVAVGLEEIAGVALARYWPRPRRL